MSFEAKARKVPGESGLVKLILRGNRLKCECSMK